MPEWIVLPESIKVGKGFFTTWILYYYPLSLKYSFYYRSKTQALMDSRVIKERLGHYIKIGYLEPITLREGIRLARYVKDKSQDHTPLDEVQ